MKFVLQFLIVLAISVIKSQCSIMEGYKLSEWKEENLTKIEFKFKKARESEFSLNMAIPFLWNDSSIGISVYIVDKQLQPVDSINFIEIENANEKKSEYNANIQLAEFQKIDCQQSYLNVDKTIMRAQCQTFVKFYDKDSSETIYLILKYPFSIQYSTVSSVVFNGIPLQEQKDCPCCDNDCTEDPNIAEINQTANTASAGDVNEDNNALRIDTVTEDTTIFYKFEQNSAGLRQLQNEEDNQELTLWKVYAENDNYQADLTKYVNIGKQGDQIQLEANLLAPTESIGKYFGFRFIFTTGQNDSNGMYKAKILKSKAIVVNDLQISYKESNSVDSSDDSNSNTIIIIIASLGVGIILIIIIISIILCKKKTTNNSKDPQLFQESTNKKKENYEKDELQLPEYQESQSQIDQQNKLKFEAEYKQNLDQNVADETVASSINIWQIHSMEEKFKPSQVKQQVNNNNDIQVESGELKLNLSQSNSFSQLIKDQELVLMSQLESNMDFGKNQLIKHSYQNSSEKLLDNLQAIQKDN